MLTKDDSVAKYLVSNEDDKRLFDESEFEIIIQTIEKRLRILEKRYDKLNHKVKCIVVLRLSSFSWILRMLIRSIDSYLAKATKSDSESTAKKQRKVRRKQ